MSTIDTGALRALTHGGCDLDQTMTPCDDCVLILDAADEIERLLGALEYIEKWDEIAASAHPIRLPARSEIARRALAREDAEL